MFIVYSAKMMEFFLVPNYNLINYKAFVTVYFKKIKNYPLYLNKNYGLKSIKMGFQYLHSDFVKILKLVKIKIDQNHLLF